MKAELVFFTENMVAYRRFKDKDTHFNLYAAIIFKKRQRSSTPLTCGFH